MLVIGVENALSCAYIYIYIYIYIYNFIYLFFLSFYRPIIKIPLCLHDLVLKCNYGL